MNKIKIYSLMIFLVIFFININAKSHQNDYTALSNNWQISLNIGNQMSGIKREDFIYSNYSPVLNPELGKWFSPSIAFNIGYKGYYYYLISDKDKHFYNFFYGKSEFNINELFGVSNKYNWSLHSHLGSGYFYIQDYDRPNVCTDLGISYNYLVGENLSLSLDLSAIIGWDIYQGNEDILPSLSLGISYFLN